MIGRDLSLALLALPLLTGASPAAPATTDVPFETLQACLRGQWAPAGKLTAINNAAGAILDLAFETVGTDGKVSRGHATFAIEDRGIERRVTATAADPGDAPLAQQMLGQAMAACAPAAPKR